jgi:hypothetical protein
MSGAGYPPGCALVMTAAELASMERELMQGARPRPAPPAEKLALAWTAEEMRAADRRIASGLPLRLPE